jgi:hypothetical protein
MGQVRAWFNQLKIESAVGHVQKRKVIWTPIEDAQLVAFRKKWLEEHDGMWDAMVKVIPGKTIDDLKNHWKRKLSEDIGCDLVG